MCIKYKCCSIFAGILLLLLGIIIALMEVGNVLVEFWHTNIFGGFWAFLFIFQSALVMFCITCTSKRCCFKYYIVVDIITLVALGTLIGFDIYFLITPYACLLTSTCASNPAITNFQFMQNLPVFTNYSFYDSKRLFFYIQIGCAGLCFLVIFIHLITSCISIRKKRSLNEPRPQSPPTQPNPPPKTKDESITQQPLPPIKKKIQLEKSTQPPPWSISNPIIEQSGYIPPF